MLAHELSHVAHRDVLVMTVASSAGIVAGMLHAGLAVRRAVRRGRDNNGARRSSSSPCSISLVVYAISFFLLRLLSRYRELCADRAGAYLTMKPAALASALQKITGEMAAIPAAGPARQQGHERLLHRPGDQRRQPEDRSPRPTRRWSSGSSSWPGSRPSSAATEAPG